MAVIRGERVTLLFEQPGTTDPFGNPTPGEPRKLDVDGVLVAPGASSDVVESNRPDGVRVALTLHLPKTYADGAFDGAVVRGKQYRSVGAPLVWTESNTPTQWNMQQEMEAVDG